MSRVYLSLGTNQGQRLRILEAALSELASISARPLRVSPVYETLALLPPGAPAEWDQPFLNLVTELDCEQSPEWLLEKTQSIEEKQGRIRTAKWSPRTLDIDILLFDEIRISNHRLKLPHAEISKRAFVLDPLKDLAPCLILQGQSVLKMARFHPDHRPALMAILNVTPDSFSDGGEFSSLEKIHNYLTEIESSVASIDLGAESTRPGAIPISPKEEWERLKPVLQLVKQKFHGRLLRPQISIDTRNGETARRALECGAHIVNDVSGMSCPLMKEVIRSSSCQYVLMHSLGVPADPRKTLDNKASAVENLKAWFELKLAELESAGIGRERILIDPGIGFGKTPAQNYEILRNLPRFWDLNCRILVGHSRKSFLSHGSSVPPPQRDYESIGLSLALEQAGVDVLRVHNPLAHQRSHLAFRKAQPLEKRLS